MRRSLRSRASALVAGVVSSVLVLSGCSIYDAPLPGGPDTGDNPIEVTLMFRDVLDLVPQSTVKVDDVTVGKVTEVKLKGYIAKVTIALPRSVDLPDNATAQIRQTSLLGEKFISLSEPRNPGSGKLSDGDEIGLERTGRNPEVEEVFGALALLLNGGGVGQLKTIAAELNNAFGGREEDIKSVLDQIRIFVTTLDENKSSIVEALENTNRLAVQLRKQDGTIKATLDDVPDALASIDRQRDDLVKLLEALTRLSGVGVRVIQASKESTINSLRSLAPVLEGFAKAGDAFPKALQVYLTYPFVDEAVGRDPQVARNLHMGDYTNLSATLDVSLADLPQLPGLPTEVCAALAQIRQQVRDGAAQFADQIVKPLEDGGAPPQVTGPIRDELEDRIIERFLEQAERQCRAPNPGNMLAFGQAQLNDVIADLPAPLRNLLNQVPGLDDVIDGVVGGTISLPTPTLPTPPGGLSGLPRAQLGSAFQTPGQIDPFGLAARGFDPGVGTLLFQGVATQR